jgi:hypothetical protein
MFASAGSLNKPAIVKKVSSGDKLNPDAKYNVFKVGTSNKVIVSEQSVRGRMLNEQLNDLQDFKYFMMSAQQTELSSQVFEFD